MPSSYVTPLPLPISPAHVWLVPLRQIRNSDVALFHRRDNKGHHYWKSATGFGGWPTALKRNIQVYNAVLKIKLPTGVEILGLADDSLVVISAKTVNDLETQSNIVLARISNEIANLGLQIAAENTESVLFTVKYKYAIPRIVMCGTPIKLA